MSNQISAYQRGEHLVYRVRSLLVRRDAINAEIEACGPYVFASRLTLAMSIMEIGESLFLPDATWQDLGSRRALLKKRGMRFKTHQERDGLRITRIEPKDVTK